MGSARLIAAALATAVLAGCGVDIDDAGVLTSVAPPAPAPDPGIPTSGDQRAYRSLCAGRVDVIEVATPPSPADAARCARRGHELADPIQLASDAVVLAVRDGPAIGGDCITVQQATDVFRAGSPITNWSQLGFDDLPLRATGREPGSEAFGLLGRLVLDRADASLADMRFDYLARTSDAAALREVTEGARSRTVTRRTERYRTRLRARTLAARSRFVTTAQRIATRRMLVAIARADARDRRRGLVADAAARAARDRRLVALARRRAARRADAAYDARLNAQVEAYRRRQHAAAAPSGTVGAFRFSTYERFAEDLRPLAIDAGADARPACVVPSRATIASGVYPLTLRRFAVTSRRALLRREVRDRIDALVARS